MAATLKGFTVTKGVQRSNTSYPHDINQFRKDRRDGNCPCILFLAPHGFLDPLNVGTTRDLLENCCAECMQPCTAPCSCRKQLHKPKLDRESFQVTFKFRNSVAADAFLDKYQGTGVKFNRVSLEKKTLLILPPQDVLALLKAHRADESLLKELTLSEQHFLASKTSLLDAEDAWAAEIYKNLHKIEEASSAPEANRSAAEGAYLKYSAKHQKCLMKMFGRVKEDDCEEEDKGGEEDEEDASPKLSTQGRAETQGLIQQAKGFCAGRSVYGNTFGNIMSSAGTPCIVGGSESEVLSISPVQARCLSCVDDRFLSRGEQVAPHQDTELLSMLRAGPCRDGGAWRIHFVNNETCEIPRSYEPSESASQWLVRKASESWSVHLTRAYIVWRGANCPEEHIVRRMFMRCIECDLWQKPVGALSPVEACVANFYQKNRAPTAYVATVHRHGRTGDLAHLVRNPIVKTQPAVTLLVDQTLRNSKDIRVTQRTCSLIGGDFDGDRVMLVTPAEGCADLLREKCAIPNIRFNAIGEQQLHFSGIAPLALELAQRGGDLAPHETLSRGGFDSEEDPERCDRVRRGCVVWAGLLGTVYDPRVLFDVLGAIGPAWPELVAGYARPSFAEVAFDCVCSDGWVVSSIDTNISYDGFYPVSFESTKQGKCEEIEAAILDNADLFPQLAGRRFRVVVTAERPSSFDYLSFKEIQSMVQVCTTRNYDKEVITVVDYPPSIVRGACLAKVAGCHQSAPVQGWYRIVSCLAKLRKAPPQVRSRANEQSLRGYAAIRQAVSRCKWVPSDAEVAVAVLEYCASGASILPEGCSGISTKGLLVEAAKREAEIEASEYPEVAQLLRRHSRSSRRVLPTLAFGTVEGAALAWDSMDLSLVCKLRLAEGVDGLRVTFERGRMLPTDWDALAAGSEKVVAVPAAPCVKLLKADNERPAVRNWARFAACIRPKTRVTEGLRVQLDRVAWLRMDDRTYWEIFSALEVLGQRIAKIVARQPSQDQVMPQQDAHCRAAYRGLNDFGRHLLRASSGDYPSQRVKLQDLLVPLTRILAKGQLGGRQDVVRSLCGGLALCDWTLGIDELRLGSVCGTFLGDRGDRTGVHWRLRFDRDPDLLNLCGTLLEDAGAFCLRSSRLEVLVELAFPCSAADLQPLGALAVDPILSRRWCAALNAAEPGSPCCGEQLEDSCSDAFRVYQLPGTRLRVVAVAAGAGLRTWCLVDGLAVVKEICPAVPNLPPAPSDEIRTGPDSRLRRDVLALSQANDRLYVNENFRAGGLAISGRLFANTSTAFALSKMAAAYVTAMPVFGPPTGFRPDGGNGVCADEMSSSALGSVTESSMMKTVALEADCARSTAKGDTVGKTAFVRKRSVQNANTCTVVEGGMLHGPASFDGYCRNLNSSGNPCMHTYDTKRRCCPFCGHAMPELQDLVRPKRLLEDAKNLGMKPKYRMLKLFESSGMYFAQRGSKIMTLTEAICQPCGPRGGDDEPVRTVLPEHHILASDVKAAATFPGTVYFRDGARLRAWPLKSAPDLPAASNFWMLAPGQYLLIRMVQFPMVDVAIPQKFDENLPVDRVRNILETMRLESEPQEAEEDVASEMASDDDDDDDGMQLEADEGPMSLEKITFIPVTGMGGCAPKVLIHEPSRCSDASIRRQLQQIAASRNVSHVRTDLMKAKQWDVPIPALDFVVVSVFGNPPSGDVQVLDHGGTEVARCRGCGASSCLRILRQWGPVATTVGATRAGQRQTLTDLCDPCVQELRAAATSKLPPDFSEADKDGILIQAAPHCVAQCAKFFYRVFAWMRSCGMNVVPSSGRVPRFLVATNKDLTTLRDALQQRATGPLVKGATSLIQPQFSDRLDTATKTQGGKMTFMDTIPGQKLRSCPFGSKHVVELLKDDTPQFITSAAEEGMIGNSTPDRWSKRQRKV